VRLYQIGLLIVALSAWESLVSLGVVDEFFFPRPSAILLRVVDWLIKGEVYRHLTITLTETLLAFVLGTGLGIGMGFWLGLVPLARVVLDPYIKAFNAIPRIILAPIFTLWFGLGILSKVVLGTTLVFFLAFFNTYEGIREVNPMVLANARMLGAEWHHLLRHVYLPSAAGWILSSLRTSIGFAVVGAVVGEFLGAAAGIGYLIAQAEGVFDSTGVFAGMGLLVFFVLILDMVVSQVEQRLLVWRPAPLMEEQA
jgi:NitT/TauT family transport system permease protein